VAEHNDTQYFHMADVGRKRITARRAVAVGEFAAGPAFDTIVARALPKGDALMMAEVAGLAGAKGAPQLLPMCHPLPLEHIAVHCEPVADRQVIRVYCEAATHARTGVEMEALAGVNAALLTLYDLTKPVYPALGISGIRLLFKEGGKKGLWFHPEGMTDAERARYEPRGVARLDGIRTAVMTLSDRASRGDYEDRAGPRLVERLRALGARVAGAVVLPDEPESLIAQLREQAAAGTRLVVTTGGTVPGPRDCTPAALARIADRHLAGLAEMFRSESSQHTPLAWLSDADAVVVGEMLVIALPGNPKAVEQGMDILAPILAHTLKMIAAGAHP
jgi:molybdenum cofactor biosynthesis protein MoaC